MPIVPRNGPTIDEIFGTRSDRISGKYRGEVTDIDDPKKIGRLRVSVPNITDEKGVWSEPCVPYAGNKIGLFALPPVGTGVWVEPIDGRIDRFVYCGFFWREGELVDAQYAPQTVYFQTQNARIEIKDADDQIKIQIKEMGILTIKGGEITLEATSVTQDVNGNKVVLDGAGFDALNAALKVK